MHLVEINTSHLAEIKGQIGQQVDEINRHVKIAEDNRQFNLGCFLAIGAVLQGFGISVFLVS